MPQVGGALVPIRSQLQMGVSVFIGHFGHRFKELRELAVFEYYILAVERSCDTTDGA